MSTLKEKAEQILQEKEEKIIPENIKKDEVIFDVTGTYEGSGGNITTYNYFIQDNSAAQPGLGRIDITEHSNGDFVSDIVSDDINYNSLKNFTNTNYNMLIFGYTLQDYSTNKLVLCNGSNTKYTVQCYGYGGTDLGVFEVLPHSHIYTELNSALNDIIYVR